MSARDDPPWPTLSVFSGRGGAIAPPDPAGRGGHRPDKKPVPPSGGGKQAPRIGRWLFAAGQEWLTRVMGLGQSAYGLILWYWKHYRRSWRTNPDTRLATLGLGAGIACTLLLALLLRAVFPGPSGSDLPPIDPSVAAPQLAWIEAVPGQQDDPTFPDSSEDPVPPGAGGAGQTGIPSPRTFRFEQFVQRDAAGTPAFLSRAVRQHVQGWYPAGTPATHLLRFIGEVVRRAEEEEQAGQPTTALNAAKTRCLHMPTNKVFTEGTIVCTYTHAMPVHAFGTSASARSPTSRPHALWMVAFSYDRKGLITTLEVRARQIGDGSASAARSR